ncbi:MAG TPA: hypothetical protein VFE11_16990 [Dongiaceae bacterium]|nr:hypothetical protein [Dongiaceae bacterium]
MGATVSAKAIIVHELAHARAALTAAAERGVPVALWSAPGAAAYAGAGWFSAVLARAAAAVPAARFSGVLDCADRPDLVQAALRQGLAEVCYRGPDGLARRLADIAHQRQATLHRRRPPALDLGDARDPLVACRQWLARD